MVVLGTMNSCKHTYHFKWSYSWVLASNWWPKVI